MNNPEDFVMEPAVAPISLVAQMQEIIDEQERTIKAMARDLAWQSMNMSALLNAARLNNLDTQVDFQ